ncbi:hypothetical protein [Methylobacterium marchantiae]|uniref:Uncharacterized protein n=1 Tax=Methylobacterium marchantiae TaxID=600331 RepID=A0ABW3WRX6_9HYPH|nr:hypothetical protein AIGOOFII_3013 [Methylobacterium marchantiae]
MTSFIVPDGNEAIRADIPAIVELIERTARWVHPETFKALPVWCPYTARGQPLYDATWTRQYTNTRRATKETSNKFEGNVAALKALVSALGVSSPKPRNWTVCHIWGYDDPAFAAQSSIVQDPRYFSCIGNMVWLPTPLKGFTDALPEVKKMLRICSYNLYGWACEHPSVKAEAEEIRSGIIPVGYPRGWPSALDLKLIPLGTAPYTDKIRREILVRKAKWRRDIDDLRLVDYPRDQVKNVLDFWKIDIYQT